jgi:hypothetical protein
MESDTQPMLKFFRRSNRRQPKDGAITPSGPPSPSKSLRHALVKYVAQSAIELEPELLPPFLNPTVPPSGDFLVEVVGEWFNQPVLHAILRKSANHDAVEWEGIAQLVAEPDNPFDPNRVKVVIQEMTAGYLSEELAFQLKESLLASEELVTVRAKLSVGTRRSNGSRAPIEVRLDFDPNELAAKPVQKIQS